MRRHPVRWIAAVGAAVVVAGGSAVYSCTCSTPVFDHSSPGLANLWVDTTGGTCTRSATPVAYADAAACSSYNAASAAAQANDLVLIRDGTYGGQTIDSSPAGTGPVTYRAENGKANVIINGDISGSSAGADYVTVDGFTLGNNDGGNYGTYAINLQADDLAHPFSHWTLKNFSAHWGVIMNAHDILLQHGDIGYYHACTLYVPNGYGEDSMLFNVQSGSGLVTNTTFDDVTFHDVDRWANKTGPPVCSNPSSGQPHTDCLQAFAGTGITIENSHFYNCATSDVLAKPDFGTIDGWTIQNNEFGGTLEGGNGVLIGDTSQSCAGTTPTLVQNNVFYAEGVRVGCTGTTAIVRNNVLPPGQICSGADENGTFSYNVLLPTASASCTGQTGVQTCTPTWVDPSTTTANYDTASGDTCARDHADPTSGHYPATDIHGVARPRGSAPDVGANEAG